MRTVICHEVTSVHGKLRAIPDTAVVYEGDSHYEAWARALYNLDPFQVAPEHRVSLPPSLIETVQPEDTKLALVQINHVPMFVQIPAKRVGQDGKVKLSWDEIRRLGGVPDGGCIKLG